MPDLFAYLEGFGTGESFTKSVIIVTDLSTGSTVTATKGETVKTSVEKDGKWWFRNLDLGEWTLKATLGDQSATTTYNIEQFGVYYVSMSYFEATISVVYSVGAICTCYKGDEILQAPDTSGKYDFIVHSAGLWTVKKSIDGKDTEKTVLIESSGQREEVNLAEYVLIPSDGLLDKIQHDGWYEGATYEDGVLTIDMYNSASAYLEVDVTDYSNMYIKGTYNGAQVLTYVGLFDTSNSLIAGHTGNKGDGAALDNLYDISEINGLQRFGVKIVLQSEKRQDVSFNLSSVVFS